MTPEQMVEGLAKACEDARQHVARDCGRPFVLTTEAMGYRIVPEWVVDAFAKFLAKVGTEVIVKDGGG